MISTLFQFPEFRKGDHVKVKDGPFQNFQGTVDKILAGRDVAVVMLEIFGRHTPLELEFREIERAKA